jgi:hypothetical protein
MKNNQKGFGAVEGLLLLIVVLFVGFIGYYVYNTQKKTTDTQNAAASASSSDVKSSLSSYSGWQSYTSAYEPSLSFKYPADWTLSKDGADYAGVDAATITSPNGSKIHFGAGPAGYGGQCAETDKIVISYSEPITGAPGLYVVKWHGNTKDTKFLRAAVVSDAPDGKTKPKVDSYTGCIYPNQFESKNKNVGFELSGEDYKAADDSNVVKILASLNF